MGEQSNHSSVRHWLGCCRTHTCRPHRRSVATGPARSHEIEIDLVGADRGPIVKELLCVGSVKWLENPPFDRHGLAALYRHRAALTDEPVPTVVVSRSGVDCTGADAACGPAELLRAWSA